MVIRPSMVKYIVRGLWAIWMESSVRVRLFMTFCSSTRLQLKNVSFNWNWTWKFQRPEITEDDVADLRSKLGIASDETMLLSLSRVLWEKHPGCAGCSPFCLEEDDKVRLVVAGDGPYLPDLKSQAKKLGIQDKVVFTGMIAPSETALYYKSADFFISASTSETQAWPIWKPWLVVPQSLLTEILI